MVLDKNELIRFYINLVWDFGFSVEDLKVICRF